MKKFLVYGLVTVVIGGLGVAFNSWEYKGDIKVRDFNAPPKVNREVLESTTEPTAIQVKDGQTFVVDMQNAKINLKYHDGDTVLLGDIEDTATVLYDTEGKNVTVRENSDAALNGTFDYITISLPKNANFNLDIKTNNSQVFGEVDTIKNLEVDTDKGLADIKVNKVDNINVETGYGNIGLTINQVNGQITGTTGVGSVNFDIENEDNINLKGYKVYSDKTVKVDETNKGNQKVDIKGDIAKVIFY